MDRSIFFFFFFLTPISETLKPPSLKLEGPGFGIWYVALSYGPLQDCLNYNSRVKNGPAPRALCFT